MKQQCGICGKLKIYTIRIPVDNIKKQMPQDMFRQLKCFRYGLQSLEKHSTLAIHILLCPVPVSHRLFLCNVLVVDH